jgi:streptothricin acetyltransferase
MQIIFREIVHPTTEELALQDESFLVDSVLVLRAMNNVIDYSIISVPPYPKRYKDEQENETLYPGKNDRTAYIAYADGEKAGRIILKKSWNNLAYIDDLCVDSAYRNKGLGTQLLSCAEEWARSHDLPGIMLETQNNNVNACRLYARCGFELCGFDTHLYITNPECQNEIALYWYKIFKTKSV